MTQSGLRATFHTSQGDFTCVLFEQDAPNTVKNFVELAEGTRDWKDSVSGKKGPGPLFSGTVFHRVIPQFMIQGGDPSGTGMGGPGYKFADEKNARTFSKPGVLAMANSGPNTNGSQIFVTVAATPWLNGNHTIFGEVVDGYNVVEKISGVSRDRSDRPLTPVTLESVTIKRT